MSVETAPTEGFIVALRKVVDRSIAEKQEHFSISVEVDAAIAGRLDALARLTASQADDFQRLKSQVKRLIEAGDHLEKDLKEHWEETRSMQKWAKAKEVQ